MLSCDLSRITLGKSRSEKMIIRIYKKKKRKWDYSDKIKRQLKGQRGKTFLLSVYIILLFLTYVSFVVVIFCSHMEKLLQFT